MTDIEINRKYHALFGQKAALERDAEVIKWKMDELQRTCPHQNRKRYGDDEGKPFEQCQACYQFIEVNA